MQSDQRLCFFHCKVDIYKRVWPGNTTITHCGQTCASIQSDQLFFHCKVDIYKRVWTGNTTITQCRPTCASVQSDQRFCFFFTAKQISTREYGQATSQSHTADQPAHPCSLISAFVFFHCKVAIYKRVWPGNTTITHCGQTCASVPSDPLFFHCKVDIYKRVWAGNTTITHCRPTCALVQSDQHLCFFFTAKQISTRVYGQDIPHSHTADQPAHPCSLISAFVFFCTPK